MPDGTAIDRETKDGIGPDGIDVRVYSWRDVDLPSVTTILKTRDADMSNLHDWQDDNDGEGDNANHEYLFWYSRNLGTLGHWHALQHLDPHLPWTDDEDASAWALQNVQDIEEGLRGGPIDPQNHEEVWDATPREVLYSVLKDHNTVQSWGEFYDSYSPHATHETYSTALWHKVERDVEFFEMAQQRLWSKLGIEREDTIAVERFLFDEAYQYAGQVDLVYRDGDDVVVADLKSSSGCYEKHKIQGAAYAKAVERDDEIPVDSVDRLEVHRAHPRSGQIAVHTDDPTREVHTAQYWNEDYEDLWATFRDLATEFEYDG